MRSPRRWSGWSDSNRRPRRPKRRALAKLRHSPMQSGYRGQGRLLIPSLSRLAVRIRWQLAHTTSHLAISSTRRSVDTELTTRDIKPALSSMWSKSMTSGGKRLPQSVQGTSLSRLTKALLRSRRALRRFETNLRWCSPFRSTAYQFRQATFEHSRQ